MDRLILMILILFIIGFSYTFIVQRFSKSKIIILLPTILGIILLIYTAITSNPNDSDGLEAITIFIKELITFTIIVGNMSGFFYYSRK